MALGGEGAGEVGGAGGKVYSSGGCVWSPFISVCAREFHYAIVRGKKVCCLYCKKHFMSCIWY